MKKSLTSKIGLGTVQFGIPYGISNKAGQTSSQEVSHILTYAREIGIKVLDTASSYGKSEITIGNNQPEDFKIISKFLSTDQKQSITLQLKESLKKLRLPSLYGYLAHRPLDIVNNPRQWDELNELKTKNWIEKIGFSFNEIAEIEAVVGMGFIPDIIQVPYNYLDNRFESYMIDFKKTGCEIHSRSAFLQGLFFVDTEKLSPFFKKIKPVLLYLKQYDKELPGMLLKYCIDKHFIDKVIFGVNNLNQFKTNISCIKTAGKLPYNSINIDNNILIPSRWPKNENV